MSDLYSWQSSAMGMMSGGGMGSLMAPQITKSGGAGLPWMGMIGGAMQAYGRYAQGQAQAAGYAAGKRSARYAAAEAIQQGKYGAWRSNEAARRVYGSQVNAFARAGVEMSGTATDVLAESMKQMTLDRLMTIRNARAQARGYLAQAKDFEKAEKASKKSGTLGAIASIAGVAAAPFTGGASLALTGLSGL